MEKQTRVYPSKKNHVSRLFCCILLIVSFLVIASGLMGRKKDQSFSLVPRASEAPLSLDEAFDETPSSAEIQLPECEWYALQVGVFENADAGQKASEVFQERGAAGYIWPDGRYRVLAAVYPSREDAQNVRTQIREQHSIDSYLYSIKFPAVRMAVNGMRGQLEILQAAFQHAHDLALQMHQISTAVDRREKNTAEVKEQLRSIDTQMSIVRLRLEQRFPKPYHKTVQALVEFFTAFSEFATAFSEDGSAFSNGVQLKYETFVILENIQKIYHTLGHTQEAF